LDLIMNPRFPSVETAMSSADFSRSVVAEARADRPRGFAHAALAVIHGLREILTAVRQRRETIAQLRALSDRELADIGVDRGAIPSVAARPFPANDSSEARRAA
jgi:uncharacterized protein YjiS (DUF1127 family)